MRVAFTSSLLFYAAPTYPALRLLRRVAWRLRANAALPAADWHF